MTLRENRSLIAFYQTGASGQQLLQDTPSSVVSRFYFLSWSAALTQFSPSGINEHHLLSLSAPLHLTDATDAQEFIQMTAETGKVSLHYYRSLPATPRRKRVPFKGFTDVGEAFSDKSLRGSVNLNMLNMTQLFLWRINKRQNSGRDEGKFEPTVTGCVDFFLNEFTQHNMTSAGSVLFVSVLDTATHLMVNTGFPRYETPPTYDMCITCSAPDNQ